MISDLMAYWQILNFLFIPDETFQYILTLACNEPKCQTFVSPMASEAPI